MTTKRFVIPLVILAVVGGVLLFAGPFTDNVQADCDPCDQTPGDDTVVVDGDAPAVHSSDINTGDGADNVTVEDGGFVVGDINTGAENDTINNSGSGLIVGNIDGGEGDDIINNSGSEIVTGSIDGGGGDDVINNSGSGPVAGSIDGGEGDDTINNSGSGPVVGGIDGGGGDDTINNSGDVTIINGGDGDDTVTIVVESSSGSSLDGGEGNEDNGGDTLVFSLPAQHASYAAELATKNPDSDTITIDGTVYTWVNFEELLAILQGVLGAQPAGPSGPVVAFDDGNTLKVFSEQGMLHFYRLDEALNGLYHSSVGYDVYHNVEVGTVVHDVTDADGYRVFLSVMTEADIAAAGLAGAELVSGQRWYHLQHIAPDGTVLVDAHLRL